MKAVTDILRSAYASEIETVQNYLALSVALDGITAEEVKERLGEDILEELGHAKALAQRLKEKGEIPPGSLEVKEHLQQTSLQPPANTTDVASVVKGVVQAEEDAIALYQELFHAAESEGDMVTQDLAVNILTDEEKHRALFAGFEKALTASGAGPGLPSEYRTVQH